MSKARHHVAAELRIQVLQLQVTNSLNQNAAGSPIQKDVMPPPGLYRVDMDGTTTSFGPVGITEHRTQTDGATGNVVRTEKPATAGL